MKKITFAVVQGGGKAHIIFERTPRRTLCGISAVGMAEVSPTEAHLSRMATSDDFRDRQGCLKCQQLIDDEERLSRAAFTRWADRITGMRKE